VFVIVLNLFEAIKIYYFKNCSSKSRELTENIGIQAAQVSS